MQVDKKVFEKSKDAPSRFIEGKALIVMPATSTSYVLNETGARAFELIDGKRSAKEIAAAVCNEFDVAEARARSDVLELLNRLEKEKIIFCKGGENGG